MYRCDICQAVSPAGQQRKKFTLRRRDGQISRELSVCDECDFDLNCYGMTVEQVHAKHARRVAVPAAVLVNRTVELGDDVPTI